MWLICPQMREPMCVCVYVYVSKIGHAVNCSSSFPRVGAHEADQGSLCA